jgi:hypothetical protein
VALLERIRDLLYNEGFTIKGAQKHLSAKSGAAGRTAASTHTPSVGLAEAISCLEDARDSIAALQRTLDKQS